MKKQLCLIGCIFLCPLFSLFAEINPPSRIFELGTDITAGISNNYFAMGDIFSKTITLDFNKITDNLQDDQDLLLSADAGIQVFMNLNLSKFRLNVFAGTDATGSISLPYSMFDTIANGISANKTISGSISGGADVFFQAGMGFSAKTGSIRFKITPALFVPVVHISDPKVSYSFVSRSDGTLAASALVSADVYSLFDLDKAGLDASELFSNFGVDLAISAEMPVFTWLDAGISLANIPLSPSKLKYKKSYYKRYECSSSESILSALVDGKEFNDIFVTDESDADLKGKSIAVSENLYRLLKLELSAAIRPFPNRELLTVTPSMAFKFKSNSTLTANAYQEGIFDFAIKTDFRPVKFLGLLATTAYQNKAWLLQGGTVLNFRVFELDLAIATRSSSFAGCFTGNGLSAGIGIRFGY